jgi:hypothetical protein
MRLLPLPRLCCAVVALLVGCVDSDDSGPIPNAALADLPQLELSVTIYSSSALVAASYDGDVFRRRTGACAIVDASVTLGGAELEPKTPGAGESECPALLFGIEQFRASSDESVHLRLSDDSSVVTADYAVGQLVARDVTTTSWTFEPGGEATFEWSRPDDLDGSHGEMFATFMENDSSWESLEVTTSGSQVRVAFPTFLSGKTGDLHLVVNIDSFERGTATTCEGAVRCDSAVGRAVVHAAEIR